LLSKRVRLNSTRHIPLKIYQLQMKQIVVFAIFFLCVVPAPAMAQDIIKKGESLNLERCIEIALKKQPVIAAAVGNVDVNASRVGEAKSNY